MFIWQKTELQCGCLYMYVCMYIHIHTTRRLTKNLKVERGSPLVMCVLVLGAAA